MIGQECSNVLPYIEISPDKRVRFKERHEEIIESVNKIFKKRAEDEYVIENSQENLLPSNLNATIL